MSISGKIVRKLVRRRMASEPMFDISIVEGMRAGGSKAIDAALRAEADRALAVLQAGGTIALTDAGKLFARLGPLFDDDQPEAPSA